jgi:uroporphyrin-III C-methyltransferase
LIAGLGRVLDSVKSVARVLGKVFLVGAGPGDPELITLKGKRCLEAANVVIYDQLANCELLSFAPVDAELLYVGKKGGGRSAIQREIEARLIREAYNGKIVVRLKGGDPFLFGRGGEEAQALAAAGIPFEIIPGISSAFAVPAYAGIPVTHRDYASSVAIVTGRKASGDEMTWSSLIESVDTLIILMGRQNLRKIMNRLLACGCDPTRPSALIESGTLGGQSSVIGTIETLADLAEQSRPLGPSLIIIGKVVKLSQGLQWFYAASRHFDTCSIRAIENTAEIGPG